MHWSPGPSLIINLTLLMSTECSVGKIEHKVGAHQNVHLNFYLSKNLLLYFYFFNFFTLKIIVLLWWQWWWYQWSINTPGFLPLACGWPILWKWWDSVTYTSQALFGANSAPSEGVSEDRPIKWCAASQCSEEMWCFLVIRSWVTMTFEVGTY